MRGGVGLVVLCGCSFPTGGVDPGDAGVPPDMAPPRDVGADADAAPPDMGCPDPEGPCCGAPEGRRICVDDDTTGSCVGGEVVTDRSCPRNSGCNANPSNEYDYVCELEIECTWCNESACGAGEVCSFFADYVLILYCCVTAPADGGEAYAECAQDDDCKSGLCLYDGPTGSCFWSCMDGCPAGGSCGSHDATVDGVETSVWSCLPD